MLVVRWIFNSTVPIVVLTTAPFNRAHAQLKEQLTSDVHMHMAIDEMGTKLAEEADAQLIERKR